MQYQYRTYLIDLNGSDTYFDHDSEEWLSFDVITQFGGEIMQIIPMAHKDLAKFKGWKTTMDRAGGDMANIPAVALVRFVQHADDHKQPLTATIDGLQPAEEAQSTAAPDVESDIVRQAHEDARRRQEADALVRRAMQNRPSPYARIKKDEPEQE